VNRKRCFDPIVDARTRLLILGSLPGEESLQHMQYYANKRNAFWYLISQVLDVDLVPLRYEDRLATLLEHQIGLWDVIADAVREGSLDANITQHRGNDLQSLLAARPSITAIAFNGRTAAKLGLKQVSAANRRISVFELPSSSPAHTLAVAKKLEDWMHMRSCLTVTGPDLHASGLTVDITPRN
jgi:hypoxanthine-DNA glycosylase